MKNLVFTIFIKSDSLDKTHGEFKYHDLYEYAIEKAKKYSQKCNADFIVIEDDSAFPGWTPIWQRFAPFVKYKDYDNILYLDADLVITDSAPNIFETMSKWDEEVFASIDYETIPGRAYCKYFNAGIIAFKRSFLDKFTYDEIMDEMKRWKYTKHWDQEALNSLVKKKTSRYIDLGRSWNTMNSNLNAGKYAHGVHYIHYHKRKFNKDIIEQYEKDVVGTLILPEEKINIFPKFWREWQGDIVSAEKQYDKSKHNL